MQNVTGEKRRCGVKGKSLRVKEIPPTSNLWDLSPINRDGSESFATVYPVKNRFPR
jgi:hypothetical protein